MHYNINSETNQGLSAFELSLTRISNKYAIVVSAIFLVYTVVFIFYFNNVLWLPILGLISGIIALFLNFRSLPKISRIILATLPVLCTILSEAFITPSGNTPPFGLHALTIVFILFPLITFDPGERNIQMIIIFWNIALFIGFPFLNQYLEKTLDYGFAMGFAFTSMSSIITIGATVVVGLEVYFNCKELYIQNDDLTREGDKLKEYNETTKREMSEKLQELEKVKKEDEKKGWINEGLAKMGQMVRTQNNIKQLYDELLPPLVKYINANQAGLYVYNENNEMLELKACFAYNRKKFIDKSIKKNIGLLGECFKSQLPIELKDVPEDYAEITSGLGGAVPRHLLLIPLKDNEGIQGVIEVGAFDEFRPETLTFLLQLGEELGAMISNNRLHEVTRELLEQSKEQEEEMVAQEDMLRMNLEELEASQNEIQRKKVELQEKENKINAFINGTNDMMMAINNNYIITVVNESLRGHSISLGCPLEVGDNLLKVLAPSELKYMKAKYEQAFMGKSISFIRELELKNGSTEYLDVSINPIRDSNGDIVGISEVSRNKTKEVLYQKALNEKESTLKTALNYSSDTFFAINPSYKIIVANDTLRKRFKDVGVKMEEGADIRDVLSPEQFEYWNQHYLRIFGGERYTFEQDRPVENDVLHLKVHCIPIFDINGNIIGASVRSQDITELKKLKQGSGQLAESMG